jgi:hypothetical protein
MGNENGKVSIGFKIFIIFVEISISFLILSGAWLIDKLLVSAPFVVALRLTRIKIET